MPSLSGSELRSRSRGRVSDWCRLVPHGNLHLITIWSLRLLWLVHTWPYLALIGHWDSPHTGEIYPEWSSKAGSWLHCITHLYVIIGNSWNFFTFSLLTKQLQSSQNPLYNHLNQLIQQHYICTGRTYYLIWPSGQMCAPPGLPWSYGLRSHSDRWPHMGALIMLQFRGSHIHNTQCALCTTLMDVETVGIMVLVRAF